MSILSNYKIKMIGNYVCHKIAADINFVFLL